MELNHKKRKFPKDGDSMTYDELEVGVKLVCNQTDGNKKELIVVRKEIDEFGKESVVFESTTSCAQFYCRAEHVPLWHIERQ